MKENVYRLVAFDSTSVVRQWPVNYLRPNIKLLLKFYLTCRSFKWTLIIYQKQQRKIYICKIRDTIILFPSLCDNESKLRNMKKRPGWDIYYPLFNYLLRNLEKKYSKYYLYYRKTDVLFNFIDHYLINCFSIRINNAATPIMLCRRRWKIFRL